MDVTRDNPLGKERVGKLIAKFAIPSIVAMLIVAAYNIVDQLFIGNMIGELGNAATNIAFPLTNACLALGLCFGVGGASNYNLKLGAGEKESAPYYFGNALAMLFISGLVLAIITEVFLEPILVLFGAPGTVLPYAKDYTWIVAIGFPFAVFGSGAGHLLRADGRPNLTMVCNIVGCVLNIILDALFVVVFQWGMQGAAIATVIGQVIGFALNVAFLSKCKTLKLQFKYMIPRIKYVGSVIKLGLASFFNQITMMIATILLNNALNKYGGMSIYGSEIPIAVGGIASKVGTLFFSAIIGLSQGNQPIVSFNYGAKNYRRVKESYLRCLMYGAMVSVLAFIVFQIFPEKILGFFGKGSDLYVKFGGMYFRRYMFFIWMSFFQPISSNFFTAIGKAYKGIFLSLTRQIIFFAPAVLIIPAFLGIEGVMWVQPVADFLAIIATLILTIVEMRTPQFISAPGVFKEIISRKEVNK